WAIDVEKALQNSRCSLVVLWIESPGGSVTETILLTHKLKVFQKKYNKEIFVTPTQVKSEIKALLEFLQEKKLKYILEIGTYMGSSLFLFSQIITEDSIIISIDLPGGSHGGGYPRWRIPIYKSFPLLKDKLFLIGKNSHKLSTFNKVKKILKHNKFDFIFIDGDHSYNGVFRDITISLLKLKKKGVIAGDDYNHPPEEGLREAVREIFGENNIKTAASFWIYNGN
ncbi:hypothetical protein LCGC14_1169130, partial [marine sediment metagenome]